MSRNTHDSHDIEDEVEPIPGLPEALPKGERILWQGNPSWQSLALRAYHVRKVAIYFIGLILIMSSYHLWLGRSPVDAIAAAVLLIGMASAGLGIFLVLAKLSSWASLYTITNRRVVMRIGVAFPITLNLPYRAIESAALQMFRDGSGDIPLKLVKGEGKIAYLHLWPHARPWHVRQPQPMLRCVPEADTVSQILSEALAAHAKTMPIQSEAARNYERPAAHEASHDQGYAQAAAE